MSDYIDRQAAIDAICEHGTNLERRGITVLSVANVKQIMVDLLENLPSAEVEPVKHGRWTPVTNGRGGFECSMCHSYAPSYQDGVEWLSRYCPNCGAKMEAAPTIIEAEEDEE